MLRPLNSAPLAVLLATLTFASQAFLSQAAPAGAEVVVLMNDANLFEPPEVVVAGGTTIVWRNAGIEPHTVSSDDGLFDSPLINGGEFFSYSFEKPGAYPYACTVPDHDGMVGTIVVQ